MLALLLTGFAKSLIYQYVQQLGLFYFVPSRFDPVREDSAVLVVFPLSAVVTKQLNKLEEFVNVCILQSIIENEGKQNVQTIPKIFADPEVYVYINSVAKMPKRSSTARVVQALQFTWFCNLTCYFLLFSITISLPVHNVTFI